MTKKRIEVVQIDKGVEVPITVRLPLDTMDVGDSILIPLSRRDYVQSRMSKLKAETGIEYTAKKVSDTEIRVWRVK